MAGGVASGETGCKSFQPFIVNAGVFVGPEIRASSAASAAKGKADGVSAVRLQGGGGLITYCKPGGQKYIHTLNTVIQYMLRSIFTLILVLVLFFILSSCIMPARHDAHSRNQRRHAVTYACIGVRAGPKAAGDWRWGCCCLSLGSAARGAKSDVRCTLLGSELINLFNTDGCLIKYGGQPAPCPLVHAFAFPAPLSHFQVYADVA